MKKYVIGALVLWVTILAAYAIGLAWFLDRVLSIVEKALGK